jgi:hypothetical protein
MKGLLARRPSPAMIVALVALVCALTGTAWAALGKNSVGTKQLKNGAVSTAKIKKEAVTAKKVKKHSLTGQNIDLGSLGTVPSATNATHATNADLAFSATTAKLADKAGALTALEPAHYVGTPGEPPFIDASNVPPEALEPPIPGVSLHEVSFYKDHEGIVHLEGSAIVGTGTPYPVIFTLPPGFRPAPRTVLTFPNSEGEEVISIQGSDIDSEGHDFSGDVLLYGGGSDNYASLNGITFRAES